ncbi:alanine:cation symporter family protein [Zhongshania sp. BJYM1]|uniref:alanine:cation symporter family protein n=1 Tax=Zhongshania aquatica TaxID=2965069 RepID=UPI0022B5D7D2|nr:alanine:cation symporter family protein [Marortus sp. BJYM1]
MLAVLVSFLSLSTVFAFWYYGGECLGFLIVARYQHDCIWFYLLLIIAGSVASLNLVVNLVDSMYALMAIPTMTSALLLAPKANAARAYFAS